MKTLKVGIADYETMKARSIAIARGEYTPKRGEPKVWFTSIESAAKILSERNRKLLELIATEKPESVAELAEMSGRAKSNLSRTLRTMERHGLLTIRKGRRGRLKPRVDYTDINIALSLGTDSDAA